MKCSDSLSRSYLFSWGTTVADRIPWNVSFKASVVLPTVDYNGDYIASDGLVLEGFESTGVPFGDPVTLYPVHGQLFDLSIAASKVVLFYKCGFLATYLTSKRVYVGPRLIKDLSLPSESKVHIFGHSKLKLLAGGKNTVALIFF